MNPDVSLNARDQGAPCLGAGAGAGERPSSSRSRFTLRRGGVRAVSVGSRVRPLSGSTASSHGCTGHVLGAVSYFHGENKLSEGEWDEGMPCTAQ